MTLLCRKKMKKYRQEEIKQEEEEEEEIPEIQFHERLFH